MSIDAFRYDGKRAVVVGGASGMGAATAELARDAGAEVVVMATPWAALEAVVAATRAGAIASMLGGMAACLAWSRLGDPYFLGLDPAEAGVLTSALMMFAVSMLTTPASDSVLRQFFGEDAREAQPAGA